MRKGAAHNDRTQKFSVFAGRAAMDSSGIARRRRT